MSTTRSKQASCSKPTTASMDEAAARYLNELTVRYTALQDAASVYMRAVEATEPPQWPELRQEDSARVLEALLKWKPRDT